MKGFDHQGLTPNLENVHYFVEGDSFIHYALWYMYVAHPNHGHEPIDYKQIKVGFSTIVDEVNTMSFSFAFVYGKLVCFYTVDSSKVDWKLVDKFMAQYWTRPDGSTRKCNAMNFEHCLAACRGD